MYAKINRTGEKINLFPKENQFCRDAMAVAEENGYEHISVHAIDNFHDLPWKGIEFNRLLVKDNGLYWFVEWIGNYPFIGIVIEKIGEAYLMKPSMTKFPRFKQATIQSILDGQKQSLRLAIDPGDHTIRRGGFFPGDWTPRYGVELDDRWVIVSKYQPNDIIRVRKSYARRKGPKSDAKEADNFFFVKITEVRAERLQEITEEEAIAEGARIGLGGLPFLSCKEAYASLWNDSIKASDREKFGWDANPWVWVINFKRCENQE